MLRCRTFLALFASLLCASGALMAAEPTAGKQVEQSVEVKSGDNTRQLHYLLYLPKGYGESDKPQKWPVLLFLHGSGERGADLSAVKKHGPPKIAEEKDLPFIVVSPQCPKDARWDTGELSQLLDHITETLPADLSRVYITGLSMGGAGTWSLAAAYPDRFAAIVPICGRADPSTAEKIKHLPTWVFHGAKDSAVSVEQSEKMVEALKKVGGMPKYTLYPEAGHDSWTESYNNPELYKWLLEQKKKG